MGKKNGKNNPPRKKKAGEAAQKSGQEGKGKGAKLLKWLLRGLLFLIGAAILAFFREVGIQLAQFIGK